MSDLESVLSRLSPQQRDNLLKALAERAPSSAAPPSRYVSRVDERHRPFPLTEIQETYLLARSGYFDLGAVGTNVFTELEFDEPPPDFDERLDRALDRLVARHEMLRCIFLADRTQRILVEAPSVRAERRSWDPDRADAEADETRERLRHGRAAIDRWPLFDAVVTPGPHGRRRVLLRIDALLIDGTSRRTVIRELAALLRDPEAPLPALECSYRDYVLSRPDPTGPSRRRDRDFWQDVIPALPVGPKLALRSEVSPATLAPLRSLPVRLLGGDDWAALKGTAARAGITPTAVALTAFVQALRRAGGDDAFSLGLVGSHRPPVHRQIGDLVGNFNTISVLGVEPDKGGFAAQASRLQGNLTDVLDHMGHPGLYVVRELRRRHHARTGMLIPVLFNSLLNTPAPGGAIRAAEATPGWRSIDAAISLPHTLLVANVLEGGDGSLRLVLQAAVDVLDEATPAAIARACAEELACASAEGQAAWRTSSPAPRVPRHRPAPALLVRSPVRGPDEESGDETLRSVLDVWRRILAAPAAGPEDDFFASGGDSLAAVRLAHALEERFGATVPAGAFGAPLTPRRLAAFVLLPAHAEEAR